MKRQTVIWTVLPNGAERDRLKLSVFVSPRLETNEGLPRPTLAQFPSFLTWPSQTVRFSVQFGKGLTLDASRTSPPAESGLWSALFSDSTYVRPYTFDGYENRRILSYPVRHVIAFLRGQYLRVATDSAVTFPETRALLEPERFGPIAFDRGTEKQLLRELKDHLREHRTVPPGSSPNPSRDFFQIKLFHRRSLLGPARTRVPVAIPDLDFHQMLSALGAYPEVLRRLGLVIDLEVPLQPGIPSSSTIKVIPTWKAMPITTDITPSTSYGLDATRFLALPGSGGEILNGMLRLNNLHFYEVIQVDVDGAAIKAMNFASTLRRLVSSGQKGVQKGQTKAKQPAEPSETASLPSLRSAGISVVRLGRAVLASQAFQRSSQLNQAVTGLNKPEVILQAGDVVRGYRIDVWDSELKRWHSLCLREGRYQFGNAAVRNYTDEGFVSMAATQAADGSSTELYLHESLFRWAGWGLCVPRPGKVINPKGLPERVINRAPDPLKLQVTFSAVPRSLPRLRFGVQYRFRARAVDLAGNSVPFGDPASSDFALATPPIRYTRFEPVSSPAMVLRYPLTPEDLLEGGITSGELQDLPVRWGESLERLVIRSFNDTPAKDRVNTEEVAERHIAPPQVSQLLAESHGMFDSIAGMNKDAYDLIVQKQGKLNRVHPEAQLQLSYLPDPIARGSALYGLPGVPREKVTLIAFPGHWPDVLPFRLKVVGTVEESARAPQEDVNGRVLTVQLPKAEMVRVRLSCSMSERDLDLMGIWQWLKEADLSADQLKDLKDFALSGLHWMLTPYREVVLVHAVQQPLIIPRFQRLQATKSLGDTFAVLTDTLVISGKSTSKVDVMAEWEEPVDALDKPIWERIVGKAHAFEVPVSASQTVLTLNHRHEFRDTKYRRVRYTAVATTRFREYFPKDSTASFIRETPENERPFVDILNSARPAAPKVLYVLPTFGWEKTERGSEIMSRRSGGGLRVYLERPWFSSGDGELLGVVCLPEDAKGQQRLGKPVKGKLGGIPNELKPYVTQWGRDPLWESGPTPTPAGPALQHFRRAVHNQANLSLDELPDAWVSVAGHATDYDESRQLWYCDIELVLGDAYWPFVRLALVRYQPRSVDNAHLSRVVLADFAQLLPDRTASVMFESTDPRLLTVSVSGSTYRVSELGKGGGEVEVSLERHSADGDGDLGWVHVRTWKLAEQAVGPGSVWNGQFSLPERPLRFGGVTHFRLVIKEYEEFIGDEPDKAVSAEKLASPKTLAPKAVRRLVYADVLIL